MNGFQKVGYVLQCSGGAGCPPTPPPPNASYQDRAAYEHNLILWKAAQQQQYSGNASEGEKVYSADECTGPVVMGVCQGQIIPHAAYHPTCHGEMLNGQCTGPLF